VQALPRSRGREREGACNKINSPCTKIHVRTLTPSPTLPRKQGREQTEFAARAIPPLAEIAVATVEDRAA